MAKFVSVNGSGKKTELKDQSPSTTDLQRESVDYLKENNYERFKEIDRDAKGKSDGKINGSEINRAKESATEDEKEILENIELQLTSGKFGLLQFPSMSWQYNDSGLDAGAITRADVDACDTMLQKNKGKLLPNVVGREETRDSATIEVKGKIELFNLAMDTARVQLLHILGNAYDNFSSFDKDEDGYISKGDIKKYRKEQENSDQPYSNGLTEKDTEILSACVQKAEPVNEDTITDRALDYAYNDPGRDNKGASRKDLLLSRMAIEATINSRTTTIYTNKSEPISIMEGAADRLEHKLIEGYRDRVTALGGDTVGIYSSKEIEEMKMRNNKDE